MVSHGAPLKTVKSFWEIAVGEQELYLKYEDIGSPNKLINHPLFESAKNVLCSSLQRGQILSFYINSSIGKHHEGWLQANHFHI